MPLRVLDQVGETSSNTPASSGTITINLSGTGATVGSRTMRGFVAAGYATNDTCPVHVFETATPSRWCTVIATVTDSSPDTLTFTAASIIDGSAGAGASPTWAGTVTAMVEPIGQRAKSDFDVSRSFIRGLEIGYSGTTTITCTAGACFIESENRVVDVTSAPSNLTSVSVTSGVHYVYGYLSSGTFTLESSTTAPVVFAAPAGTARSKSGDSTRRFLGAYYANGTKITEFTMADLGGGAAEVLYQVNQRVLSAQTNTAYGTSPSPKDLSSQIPPNIGTHMLANLVGTGGGGGAGSISLSIDGTNDSDSFIYVGSSSNPGCGVSARAISPATPQIWIKCNAAANAYYLDIYGYRFRR